jgi:hypothetical protein
MNSTKASEDGVMPRKVGPGLASAQSGRRGTRKPWRCGIATILRICSGAIENDAVVKQDIQW